jgi:hypothetical protein
MSRRSHLRPPQPLRQLTQSHDDLYERSAPVFVFVAMTVVVIMLGFVVTR